jgi:type VI secretion system protein ImpG
VQIRLKTLGGVTFDQLRIDRLRFYLDGEPPIVHAMYSAILNHGCGVMVRAVNGAGSATERVVTLPKNAIRPVGFEDDEGMVPYPARSFPGYRLIQEYFSFPEKFLFFDVHHLESLSTLGPCDSVDLLIFLNRSPRSEVTVDAENFRLGCTPIVNLFPQVCEPITISQTRAEYPVVPDIHRPMATEVYQIDSVTSVGAYLDEPIEYEPFYAIRHQSAGAGAGKAAKTKRPYWYSSRRPSARKADPGTEVVLAFVDPTYRPSRPATDAVTVRALCTNRDLPAKLPFGGDQADFQLAAPGPVGRVRCVRKPTLTLRPKLGRGLQWPLISQLSLNHLSLTDDEQGIDSLRQILRLHDFAESAITRQQIEGVASISSRRVAGRASRGLGSAVCQGLEITVDFEESHFVGSGIFLFASVLERFMSMYASINSFTQLVARARGREGILRRWPPRAGDRTLL